MYPLFDCPADSETKGSSPKRSAGIMPRVSKNEYHVLSLSFPHPQSALRCMSTALVFHVRGVCCDARLLLCFFMQAEPQQSQATQSQTDERRFVPIYTTAGPRGRQQPTPESFYYSAVKRLNITRRRMLDALLGSGCLKYYLSAKRFTQSSISSGMEYLSGSKRTVLERSSDSGEGGVTPVRRAVSSMHSNSSSSFLPVSAG